MVDTTLLKNKSQFITWTNNTGHWYKLYRALVDPAAAQNQLDNLSPRQPPKRKGLSEKYAKEMQDDTFGESGDPFIICNLKNANGKHRSEAVVNTGKPQYFIVMETNDEGIYDRVDGGHLRSYADVITGEGTGGYTKQVSAIATGIISYDTTHGMEAKTTRSKVLAFIRSNQTEMLEIASTVASHYSKTKGMNILSPKMSGTFLFLTRRNPSEKEFASKFVEHIYLLPQGASENVHLLRDRLMQTQKQKRTTRLSPSSIFKMILDVYEAEKSGIVLTRTSKVFKDQSKISKAHRDKHKTSDDPTPAPE